MGIVILFSFNYFICLLWRYHIKMSSLGIVLLILGFPLWFPLLIVGFVLLFVLYLLVWILVVVTYSIELALVLSIPASLVLMFIRLSGGNLDLFYLAAFLLSIGLSILLFYVCLAATKLTLKLTKSIGLRIKRKMMKRGA